MELPHLAFEGGWVARLAFPYGQDFPALKLEGRSALCVTSLVAFELRTPVVRVGPGNSNARAAVHMPETAVDEYDGFAAWKHEVRLSR